MVSLKWKENIIEKDSEGGGFFGSLLSGILKKGGGDWLRPVEHEAFNLDLVPHPKSLFFFAFSLDFLPWNNNQLLTYSTSKLY